MTAITNFLQIFSALTSALSAIGWWGTGVPEALQKLGVEITHIQIAFLISLALLLGTSIQRWRVAASRKQTQIGGMNNQQKMRGSGKSQLQIGGSRNRQDMK